MSTPAAERSSAAVRWAWLGLVALAFLPGIAGPFVLDDHINLQPVWEWLGGQRDARETLLGNASGPGGRPLAYATLMLNAWVGGQATPGFKLFNLALHLAVAGLLRCVLERWLRQLPSVRHPVAVAWAVALVWALHPLQVSSTLYVVQRMTLLAALAQLAAVYAYLHASDRPSPGRWFWGTTAPLLLLGFWAKESAILGLLLALIVDATLPRNRVRWHAWLLLSAGIGLVLCAWLRDPEWLARGYSIREFGLAERALSIPRVLLDHAGNTLLPTLDRLALYRDGYVLSRGWWQPASTLIALVFWLAAVGTALAFRRRMPVVLAGLAWFLASHVLESTILPLEPFFEHRNYLASAGLLLIVVALIDRLDRPPVFRRIVLGVALLLFSVTAWRAWQWHDFDTLLASEAPRGEISRRLQVDRAIRAFERGDEPAREAALATLAQGNAGDRTSAALWRLLLACGEPGADMEGMLERLSATPPPLATHNHLSALGLIARRAKAGQCGTVTAARLEPVFAQWRSAPATRANAPAMTTLERYEHELEGSP